MDCGQEKRDLIIRAQRGDRSAFDSLVLEHRGAIECALRREAGALLRAKVEIEDLVQETFLRAFRSIGEYRDQGEGSFEAWLLALARHAAQDKARLIQRKKRALGREVPLGRRPAAGEGEEGSGALDPGIPSPDSSPTKGPRRQERFDRLKEALGSLSADHREVIRLARLEGLPIEEVARRMGRSRDAASMLLVRAMQKLRAAFGSTESFHLPPRNLAQEGLENGDRS